MNKLSTDFFDKEMAERYDERNSKLSQISGCLHFLITLILKDLPARSKILSVGAGTGAEILTLAHAFPEWSFVAVEPSAPMLGKCRHRLAEAGIAGRCEFVHGYTQDLARGMEFDAALSILVAHFVKREDKANYFREMTVRLKEGGILVNAEISSDLGSQEFSSMLKNWEAVQTLMGATAESLATLPNQLKETLSVFSPTETESVLRESGISMPIRFFQALLVSSWYGVKP